MAYLTRNELCLHYTDHAEGEAVITLHGLSESGLYWTLPGVTDLVAREVPNCRHRVLDGMGHMLALENPQRLGDELLGFLSDL